ncbi:TPA: hypothetical protein N0F65_005961 [Lagenidium giganteum]|uniref:tRNA (guanine(9)-N(1))-methyltransferase n=1 Tax=Lagenidium giganteum TaxID=4803 RepID=A0AAV2ZA91_9STRA|nr:TPA: hypothetical protein N0F65_005961 [Lagenidium giganteum]
MTMTTPTNGDVPTAPKGEATAATNGMSKREVRRGKRQAMWLAKKENKKRERKEQQEEKRKHQQPVELDMSEEAVTKRKEKQIAKRESLMMAAQEGINVVIDCGFENDMTSREKKSLSQQIMFCYGVNRRCAAPASTWVTGLTGETRANLEKIGGFESWLAFHPSTQCYSELFKKESLVYLTADSPNTITELSRDKVYIIGGIVDRNRLKGATFNKAESQEIATAKLPLDAFLVMGASTRVLTVNHVFEILVQYAATSDWTKATLSTLPQRKGIHEKTETSERSEEIAPAKVGESESSSNVEKR